MVSHDPSVNVIIQYATNDKGNLIISDDLLVDEVIPATVFKLMHDGGQDIARGEDRHIGWGALVNGGHGCFVQRNVT